MHYTLRLSVMTVALVWIAGVSAQGQDSLPAPAAESAENVRLVGYHDLQGRTALQAVTQIDSEGRTWAYVGHHDSFFDGEQRHNPITGQMEWNGTSILDVSDPANPTLVWHLPNEVSANSRSVSVVYDYQFDSSPPGRDYLIRNSEASDELKFQIWDITSRDTDPSQISLVAEILGTPENSCGPGCGGRYLSRVHKGWWSPETGLYYGAAREPGFRQAILNIWDLKDPRNPQFVSRAWLEGMKDGEPEMHPSLGRWHHPIVDEENGRLYGGFRSSGDAAAWDISDPANPTLVWQYDTIPPGYSGPHTISPIVYESVPNYHGDQLPRTYALVTDETSMGKVYMFDITQERYPMPIATWRVPDTEFRDRGGRFGPHQHAERRNGELNRFEDKLAWVAYFNAGVRVLDISNPYRIEEVGFYLPTPNDNTHPMGEGQAIAIQTNDVTLDHRGLAYATDRAGTGLFILEYTGPPAGATESDR